MIAITPDLTLCRIHQNWSFSLMWCCETFIMIRRPTPVFTYTIYYKNTLSYTYSCWSYCAMIRLMEQILHSEKTLGILTLVLPTEHWYCRENLWPKQRSWMTEILHRRTGLEKTTLKRGCRGMCHSDFTAYCPICPRRCFFHNSINGHVLNLLCTYMYMIYMH